MVQYSIICDFTARCIVHFLLDNLHLFWLWLCYLFPTFFGALARKILLHLLFCYHIFVQGSCVKIWCSLQHDYMNAPHSPFLSPRNLCRSFAGRVLRLTKILFVFQCEELWLGKAHIPRISMVQGITRLQAYSFSIMDGKRVSICSTIPDLWWWFLCSPCLGRLFPGFVNYNLWQKYLFYPVPYILDIWDFEIVTS